MSHTSFTLIFDEKFNSVDGFLVRFNDNSVAVYFLDHSVHVGRRVGVLARV